MATTAYIGLGSNLDDRQGHLDRALTSLKTAEGCDQVVASPYLETRPVGGPTGQKPYLNAAAKLETTLSATQLLDLLQSIEHQEGRVRRVRWGERTLDLDLLLFGQEIIETDRLAVPHPRLMLRTFVLEPLSIIAQEAIEPKSGKSIQDLLANCERRPSVIDLRGWRRFDPLAFERVVRALKPTDWMLTDSAVETGSTEPTFRLLWKQALASPEDPTMIQGIWPPCLSINTDDEQVAISEALMACEATRGKGNFLGRAS